MPYFINSDTVSHITDYKPGAKRDVIVWCGWWMRGEHIESHAEHRLCKNCAMRLIKGRFEWTKVHNPDDWSWS